MATYDQTDERLTLPESLNDFESTEKFINPWKQFEGAFLPLWLLERPEVSANEKLLYAALAKFAGKNGYCWPSQDKLCKRTGLSASKVFRGLKGLQKLGLIKSKRRGLQRSNLYFFVEHKWLSHKYVNPNLTSVSNQESASLSNQDPTPVPNRIESVEDIHKKEKKPAKSKKQISRPPVKTFPKDSLEMRMTEYAITQIQKTHPLKFTAKEKQDSCTIFNELMRLDGKTKKEIGAVLQWIPDAVRNNGFCWADKLKSPKALRRKNKDGITKFDMLLCAKQEEKRNKPKMTQAEMNAGGPGHGVVF